MALSNAIQKTEEVDKAKEKVVAVGKTNSRVFEADGAAHRELMTDADKAIEGSKRDAVTFVACLGNPARSRSRKTKNGQVPCVVIVGYKFRANENMKVPFCPLKPNYAHEVDVIDEVKFVDVKKGQEFDLNMFETGMLISDTVYAGKFTGDGNEVNLSFKFSQDRPAPLPILRKAGEGSIKEVLDEVAVKDENGAWKVKDLYAEKFGMLFVHRSATRTGGARAPRQSDATQRNLAAAYQAFLKKNRK